MSRLETMSIRVPASLRARLTKLAKNRKSTVSAIVREALERHAPLEPVSFAEAAREFVGCLDAGPTRSLKGFGR